MQCLKSCLKKYTNYYYKSVIVFVFILSLFLTGRLKVYAAENFVYGNLTDDSDLQQIYARQNSQVFTPVSDLTFNRVKVKMYVDASNSPDDYTFRIYEGTGTGTLIAETATTTVSATSTTDVIFDFSSDVNLTASTTYRGVIWGGQWVGFGAYARVYCDTNDFNGYWEQVDSALSWTGNTCSGKSHYEGDMYFGFYENVLDGGEISFTFPTQATTTPDFSNWITSFKVYGTPPVYGYIDTTYGINATTTCTASSTYSMTDNSVNFIAGDNNFNPAEIPKNYILNPNTIYCARAMLHLDSTSTVWYSSPIGFTIGTSTIDNQWQWYYPTSTAPTGTSTAPVVSCDPNSGFWSNSMCNLGLTLFAPSQDRINDFANLKNDLSKKPPFGYVSQISSVLNFSTSTASSSYNLGDMSGLDSVMTPIKTGIAWILWLSFGFWIFNKFRNIQL